MFSSKNTVWAIFQSVCLRATQEISTYTDEERDELMFGLALAFGICGYLMLEYSLSFVLFLCKRKKNKEYKTEAF